MLNSIQFLFHYLDVLKVRQILVMCFVRSTGDMYYIGIMILPLSCMRMSGYILNSCSVITLSHTGTCNAIISYEERCNDVIF